MRELRQASVPGSTSPASPPRTSAKTPPEGKSYIGWQMMLAHLHRDALSHEFRPSRPIAARTLRRYGNLLNLPGGPRSHLDVPRTMIATEAAIRPELNSSSGCTWI